jgi:hypothetical protein
LRRESERRNWSLRHSWSQGFHLVLPRKRSGLLRSSCCCWAAPHRRRPAPLKGGTWRPQLRPRRQNASDSHEPAPTGETAASCRLRDRGKSKLGGHSPHLRTQSRRVINFATGEETRGRGEPLHFVSQRMRSVETCLGRRRGLRPTACRCAHTTKLRTEGRSSTRATGTKTRSRERRQPWTSTAFQRERRFLMSLSGPLWDTNTSKSRQLEALRCLLRDQRKLS